MKLKLKPMMMLLVIIPMIVLAVCTVLVTRSKANDLAEKNLEISLKATADAFRSAIENGHPGNYYLEDGKAYKGEYCISDDTSIVDSIKNASGCEATFFWGDTRKMTSILNADTNKRIIDTKTTDENVLLNVLGKGESYFNPSLVINGTDYYVIYYPVFQNNSKEVIGMTFIGISNETVTNCITGMMTSVLIATVAILIAAAVICILIVEHIVKAVNETSAAIDSMAQGDMTYEINPANLKRVDEVGDMCRALTKLEKELQGTFRSIIEKSHELNITSSNLEKLAGETSSTIKAVETAVDDIATGATSQAGDTTQASMNVNEMGALIKNTVNAINNLSQNSESMEISGKTAVSILENLRQINEDAVKAIDTIAEQTMVTNESALKIREATDIITSIAEETNLLSLNASIEAARAGDAGRGFAVVADQISKLAEQSNNSGQEIERITSSLIEDSNRAVETMKEVKKIMNEQADRMNKTNEAFAEVQTGIGNATDTVNGIERMSSDLDNEREKIVDIIQNLSAIAEENAANAEETSASTSMVTTAMLNVSEAAAELKKITVEFDESMRGFKF